MTFTPTDTTDYNTVIFTVSVTVNNKATPTVTAWPTASSIIYGQTLASSTLTPSTTTGPPVASVAGTFAWANSTAVPGAGNPPESVIFTPNDTTDYNTVTGSVTVAVSKATPTIATPPTASAISVGPGIGLVDADAQHDYRPPRGFRCRRVRLDHAGDSSRCG